MTTAEFKEHVRDAMKGETPNLQFDKIEINIPENATSVSDATFQTRNEYKKIVGIFFLQETLDPKAKITMDIDKKRVCFRESGHVRIFAVNDYVPAKQQAHIVSIPVNQSVVSFNYERGTGTTATKSYIYLICEQ